MSSPDWTSRPGPGRNSSGYTGAGPPSTPRVYKSKFAMRRAGRRLSTAESRTSSPTPQPGAGSPVVQSSEASEASEDERGRTAKTGPEKKAVGQSSKVSPKKGASPKKARGRPSRDKGRDDEDEDGYDAGDAGREEARVWQETYRDITVAIPIRTPSPSPGPATARRARSRSQSRGARTRSVSRGRRTTPARAAKAPVSPEVPVLAAPPRGQKRSQSSLARVGAQVNVGDTGPARRARSAARAADTDAGTILGVPVKVGPPSRAASRAASVARRASAPEAPGPSSRSKSLGGEPATRAVLPSGHPAAHASGSASTVPAKRPRGRPRKNTLPGPGPGPVPAPAPAPEASPPKRPRGRPRIHPLPEPKAGPPAQVGPPVQVGPPTPKRRGRPPGSKNRRKSEGDGPQPAPVANADNEREWANRTRYVRSIVDALEGRSSPSRTRASLGANVPRAGRSRVRAAAAGPVHGKEIMECVYVPVAPYDLHPSRRARGKERARDGDQDQEREIPVAAYDDEQQPRSGWSSETVMVERNGWTALQTDPDDDDDVDPDALRREETQVEEELRPLSTPRPTAGAKQKAKGTRATKVNAKAKAKESVQEDEQPPAKKRRMSRGQQAVAGPSVPRQAPQQPIPMPAYSASSSAPVQHGKPNSGGPRNGQPSWYPGASAQGTFYNFRVSVQPSSAARSPTTNAARPPVSAPAPAAAPVIPLPAGAAAVPVMLVPDPHEYPTHEALFEELLEHVDQWKTEKTAFRFQGSWMVTIEPNAIIDEQLVRTAAEEVGNLTEMPFSTDRNHTTVVLRGRSAQVHLLCECSEDWGLARACGGRMSLSLMQMPEDQASVRCMLEVSH